MRQPLSSVGRNACGSAERSWRDTDGGTRWVSTLQHQLFAETSILRGLRTGKADRRLKYFLAPTPSDTELSVES